MKTIEERLDILEEKMRTESFRKNTGLGNEVGYYVFDYEPEQELIVRERIRELENKDTDLRYGYELIVYDLYELMIRLRCRIPMSFLRMKSRILTALSRIRMCRFRM